jgi:GNAT superfamily N-acetyltransferase
MPYRITEADTDSASAIATIHRLNRMAPDVFPELEPRHFDGFWWFAYLDGEIVAFAGMVPNEPYDVFGVGYLKRAYVLPDHRGHGLQLRLMAVRELKARQIGWTMLVSECAAKNVSSARNFARAGYERCSPEQKWGAPNSVYFVKRLN